MTLIASGEADGNEAPAPMAFGDHVAPPRQISPAARAGADVIVFPRTSLKVDTVDMRRFARAVFQNCASIEGWIALRAFEHENAGKAVLNEWVAANGNLFTPAAEAATRVANRPWEARAVFAPPVCLFANADRATEANVACGPVIAVELDERPQDGLAALTAVLGDPTVVVASGGSWLDADGAAHNKLHVYWRLLRPAVSADERARLKAARAAATRLVGADATAVALSHPMRWPGSWHTKSAEPRLCRIIGGDEMRDIDLEWAAGELERALAAAGLESVSQCGPSGERKGFKTTTAWTAEALGDAARLIPNERLEWDRWNAIGMAFWDASHADVVGLEAFHIWSEKDARYDADVTDARWSHWSDYPPSALSAGTLLHEMRKVEPAYRLALEAEKWFEPTDAPSPSSPDPDGPLDIFGDADPAELSRPPAGSLPGLLSRWARSEARRKGVPEAWAAISALTAVGAAIGAEIRLQVQQHDESWTEGANLWTAIVADPGRAKSPIISSALTQHRRTEATWLKTDLAQHAAWSTAKSKKGKDAPPAGPEPRIRRALVDDVTAEKAVRIFADNPLLLRAPDELVGMLESFGAYKKSGGGDRSQFLRFFDGGPVTIDRVGSGTTMAERATLSILAGTQPAKMSELAKGLGDDGLLQRFIVILDDGADREAIDEAPDAEAQNAYHRMIADFLTAEYRFPPAIRMDAAAAAHFMASWQRIRQLKQAPGAGSAFKGHIEKWGKILPRIILAMHAVRQFEQNGAIDPAALVDLKSVDMAVRFARFILRHSIRFYDTYFGAPEATTEARWIAGFLLTRPDLTTVRRRDLYDARPATLRGPEGSSGFRLLTVSMRELEGAGWCQMTAQNAAGPTAWSIDPRIHVRFAERAEREKRDRAVRRKKIVEAGASRAWINADAETDVEVGVGLPSVFE